MSEIAIIDYKMSNLFSVKAACDKVGLSSIITSDPIKIKNAKVAILPGVGAFGEAMKNLDALKLKNSILDFVQSGKPILGICLGMQLLFDESDEFGKQKGLGLIPGVVKKFNSNLRNDVKYPVPQIGWNKITQKSIGWKNTFLEDNNDGDFMYFVHSYYVKPNSDNDIISLTTYGGQEYCSSVKKENIFATQFHPEKSGEVGLKIYKKLLKKLESI